MKSVQGRLSPICIRKLDLDAHSTYFKLSECEDVLISQIQLFSLMQCLLHLAAGVETSCSGQSILPNLTFQSGLGWSRLLLNLK